MIFKILDRWNEAHFRSKNKVFLVYYDWNDYWFYTSFGIFYIDHESKKHDLGGIKIGFFGQQKNDRIFEIGDEFEKFSDRYFSIGNSEEYYEALNKLPSDIRNTLLDNLNDIAKNEELFNMAKSEDVVLNSFFRSLNPSTVTGQFRRMANGGAKLTPYSFIFNKKNNNETNGFSDLNLTFEVFPESQPPTNIHVLIGKNGVGKTYLINSMINSLILTEEENDSGSFIFNKESDFEDEAQSFANLISISFSAFDDVEPISEKTAFIDNIKYSYIGLKQQIETEESEIKLKNLEALTHEFYDSLMICKSRGLTERLSATISTLHSDSNFQEAGIIELIKLPESRESQIIIRNTFRQLSSGHKIILLTITKLIEKLQEKSLVIMDEPESHLHPPLLSAFIRSVSDLLITTNGVAIVATHSPVILQEVPKSCVWKLRRSGSLMISDRLARESFGENVGTLTNEVFGLEVTDSGFYVMLLNVIEQCNYDYDDVVNAFNNQLGAEARAIIMATIVNNKK